MSEAEILHSLRSDLAILKLTAQVKLSGSQLVIQARHAPSNPVKYDQVARFLRESLRSQRGRNHPALRGIQMVTVMIGVEGEPHFLYNVTVNLDTKEGGDRDAETMDIDTAVSLPTANPHQAETIYFDRQQELDQPMPSDELDPEADTLVFGRIKTRDVPQKTAQASLATPPSSPPVPPVRSNTASVPLPLIVGAVIAAVVVLLLVVLVF